MNILVLNWRDPENPRGGGAEVYLHEVARRWVCAGHRVEWIAAGFRGAAPCSEIDGIRIRRVGSAITVYAVAGLVYLLRLRDRFDVLVDAENGIPFFSPLYVSKPKILLMHHVHTQVFKAHLPRLLSAIFVWLESWLMPRVYAGVPLVAVSESTREEVVRQSLTKRSVTVVPSGVSSDLFAGEKARVPTVAYVGRLKNYKRVDLLLRTIAALKGEFPTIVLRIAGRGDAEPRLRALSKQLNIEQNVIFEGYVSHNRKREILQEAWIFATASEIEGWGMSVIEANACGTPAVGFNVPGIRESIRNGESGVLVGSVLELRDAFAELLANPQYRARLAQGADRRVRELSWDASAHRFLQLLLNEDATGRSSDKRATKGSE